MKLLAGSLNVDVSGFLHAGYISTYSPVVLGFPRSFQQIGAHRLLAEKKVIDVHKALELKDSNATASTLTAVVSSPSRHLPPGSIISEWFTLTVVFVFFVGLLGFRRRRLCEADRPNWRPWVLVGAPLLLYVFVFHCVGPGYRAYRLICLEPPWHEIAVQEYADPEAATVAILHGLVANGLVGSRAGTTNLAAIQDEVAFPVPFGEYTPGMVYAQNTYGRDGWGREFTCETTDRGKRRIASAGSDGKHGTDDDIVAVVPQRKYEWENRVPGVYVRPVAGEQIGFVHRVDDSTYQNAHAEKSWALAGNDLFDTFSLDELFRYHTEEPAVMQRLKAMAELRQPGEDDAPLYFVQFAEVDDDWMYE